MDIRIKRVYEPAAKVDGFRVLVDRLWPRGVSKGEARIDLWAKDATPSTELRKWFSHDPERFEEFARLYDEELGASEAAIAQMVSAADGARITLIYAARDPKVNHAAVLMRYLQQT